MERKFVDFLKEKKNKEFLKKTNDEKFLSLKDAIDVLEEEIFGIEECHCTCHENEEMIELIKIEQISFLERIENLEIEVYKLEEKLKSEEK